MNKKFFLLVNLLAVLGLASCSETKNDGPKYENDTQVIVLNQGNYTEQNASISLYSEINNTVQNRAFKQKNGFNIGGTIMGATMDLYGTMYMICSNPDKIMILDGATTECYVEDLLNGHPDLVTPRYIANDGSYLYVTVSGSKYEVLPDGMYSYTESKLIVISMLSGQVVKTINIGSDAEGILCWMGYVFVAHREGVSVILAAGNGSSVIKNIDTPAPVRHLVYGGDEHIYASCPGVGLLEIDPFSQTLYETHEVEMDYDGVITTDRMANNILYYVNTYDENWNSSAKINRFNISSREVQTLLEGSYFFSIGVSPFTNNIYTAETDFSSNSTLKVLSPQGHLQYEHEVGVATCRYLFISYGKKIEE